MQELPLPPIPRCFFLLLDSRSVNSRNPLHFSSILRYSSSERDRRHVDNDTARFKQLFA